MVLLPEPEGAEKIMTLLLLISGMFCSVLFAKLIKFADDSL
jgi:hypothetical protein